MLTEDMKEIILRAFKEQLDKFGESPHILPTRYVVAFPMMSDEPGQWLMGFTIDRPTRQIPTGPIVDKFESGYTEYYGIKEKRSWIK